MALTRTLAQLRDSVQRAANVVAFTDRHPASAINDLINRGLGALQRLTATVAPEFRPIASTTITFDGTNTQFALPATFRSLILVEYIGDSDHREYLEEYPLPDRPYLADADVASSAVRASGYHLIGSNIEFLPRPPDGHTALVWYSTTATQLSADSDTADVVDRLDDFVIWWAAREIAMERDDWERHDRLGQKIAELTGEILILARSRNLAGPSRPINVIATDRFGRRVTR